MQLCSELGLDVHWQPFDSLDGILIRTRQGAVAGVASNRTFGRRRFTLAHELGHFLMHEGDFTDNGFETPSSSIEREANLFAKELLMPSHLVTQIYKGFKSLNIELDIVSELSWAFRVSKESMVIRLSELGLPPENRQAPKKP